MFGSRLKQLRCERGLNQQGLGIELNISQATVSAYENSERSPDINMLVIISIYFKVSIDYLAGTSDIRGIFKGEFNAEELNLIHQFRKLSYDKKEKLQAYAQGLAE